MPLLPIDPRPAAVARNGRISRDNQHVSRWLPPGADPAKYAELSEGIPPWMAAPFGAWFRSELTSRNVGGGASYKTGLVQEFDTLTRRSQPLATEFSKRGPAYLTGKFDVDELLHFVDFLVYKNSLKTDSESAAALEKVLTEAGSAWRVGTRDGNAGLERRVPEGVQIAAEAVMSNSGTAGELLSEAWHAAFGQSPDFEEAYEKAIKAVEEAGAAVVAPKNSVTTLGSMARDMEAQGDWALSLAVNPKHPTQDVTTKMVRALWEGQESRHGGNGYRKPTQEEAESAVLLAVPLVQWFTSGGLARR